jgi:hypothetical protein
MHDEFAWNEMTEAEMKFTCGGDSSNPNDQTHGTATHSTSDSHFGLG